MNYLLNIDTELLLELFFSKIKFNYQVYLAQKKLTENLPSYLSSEWTHTNLRLKNDYV